MAWVAHEPGFFVYDDGLANYFRSDELPEFVHQTASMVTDKQMHIWETCPMKGPVRDTNQRIRWGRNVPNVMDVQQIHCVSTESPSEA